ncbi:hypothetical protein [Arsenophonus sp. PmNCSU2021_1]
MQNSGFSRPTLPQLIDTIRGDLLTRFNEDTSFAQAYKILEMA